MVYFIFLNLKETIFCFFDAIVTRELNFNIHFMIFKQSECNSRNSIINIIPGIFFVYDNITYRFVFIYSKFRMHFGQMRCIINSSNIKIIFLILSEYDSCFMNISCCFPMLVAKICPLPIRFCFILRTFIQRPAINFYILPGCFLIEISFFNSDNSNSFAIEIFFISRFHNISVGICIRNRNFGRSNINIEIFLFISYISGTIQCFDMQYHIRGIFLCRNSNLKALF